MSTIDIVSDDCVINTNTFTTVSLEAQLTCWATD